MLIIGTFEHSIDLEQSLTLLECGGISRKHILVVPMDTAPQASIPFMEKTRELHAKGIEIGMACATGFSVIGTSIGFILTWGPIFWGLTAALIGFGIGFGIYLLINKDAPKNLPKKLPEVIVIVQCHEEQSHLVMEIMWKHRALTVGQSQAS